MSGVSERVVERIAKCLSYSSSSVFDEYSGEFSEETVGRGVSSTPRSYRNYHTGRFATTITAIVISS